MDNLFGVLFGGLISLCVADKYYKKSSKDLEDSVESLKAAVNDLKAENEALRTMISDIAIWLNNLGISKDKFNIYGKEKTIGLTISIKARSCTDSHSNAVLKTVDE